MSKKLIERIEKHRDVIGDIMDDLETRAGDIEGDASTSIMDAVSSINDAMNSLDEAIDLIKGGSVDLTRGGTE